MATDELTAHDHGNCELCDQIEAELARTKEERDRAQRDLANWEEREAACCPEDVAFDELIPALRADRDRLREDLRHANEDYAKLAAKRIMEVGQLVEERDRHAAEAQSERHRVEHLSAAIQLLKNALFEASGGCQGESGDQCSLARKI